MFVKAKKLFTKYFKASLIFKPDILNKGFMQQASLTFMNIQVNEKNSIYSLHVKKGGFLQDEYSYQL